MFSEEGKTRPCPIRKPDTARKTKVLPRQTNLTANANRRQRALKRKNPRQWHSRLLKPYLRVAALFDENWFANHPDRDFYLRLAHWSELVDHARRNGLTHRQFGSAWLVIVKRIEPGVFVRRVLYLPGVQHAPDDAMCRELFWRGGGL
jgi:hypothetical protein